MYEPKVLSKNNNQYLKILSLSFSPLILPFFFWVEKLVCSTSDNMTDTQKKQKEKPVFLRTTSKATIFGKKKH
uniref:Putative ovule protein n=1 Tax=Solanum chacoense TaxID=4108 RepID=A0A0V0H2P8_SOLCH